MKDKFELNKSHFPHFTYHFWQAFYGIAKKYIKAYSSFVTDNPKIKVNCAENSSSVIVSIKVISCIQII